MSTENAYSNLSNTVCSMFLRLFHRMRDIQNKTHYLNLNAVASSDKKAKNLNKNPHKALCKAYCGILYLLFVNLSWY